MSNSMIVEQAEERLSVSRLGKSSHRETDKDLVVIDDLLAEVKQLEGEVFAWRMRNHKLADEVKRLTPREITSVEELDALQVGAVVRSALGDTFERERIGWSEIGFTWNPSSEDIELPATVLYTPEVQS